MNNIKKKKQRQCTAFFKIMIAINIKLFVLFRRVFYPLGKHSFRERNALNCSHCILKDAGFSPTTILCSECFTEFPIIFSTISKKLTLNRVLEGRNSTITTCTMLSVFPAQNRVLISMICRRLSTFINSMTEVVFCLPNFLSTTVACDTNYVNFFFF